MSENTKQRLREIECKIEEFEEEKRKMTCGFEDREIDFKNNSLESSSIGFKEPLQDIDLKKIDPKGVTINQLRHIHRKKIEVTKIEQIEEQKKIEERQRILEALRERDRLKHEQKRESIELEKAREEREKQNLIGKQNQEIRIRQEKESEDINQFLGGTELLNNKSKENKEY